MTQHRLLTSTLRCSDKARNNILIILGLLLVYYMYKTDRSLSNVTRLLEALPVSTRRLNIDSGSAPTTTTRQPSQVRDHSVKPPKGACFSWPGGGHGPVKVVTNAVKPIPAKKKKKKRDKEKTPKLVEPVLQSSFWTLCEPRSYRFQYRSNPIDFCKRNGPVTVLILVPSVPGNYEHRNKIRQSWGERSQNGKHSFACVFLLGKPSQASTHEELQKLQFSIDAESFAHRDMVQGDFLDSYRNLTYKNLMGLDWATKFCPQAQYIFRTDDDVNVDRRTRLAEHLESTIVDNTSVMCMYEILIGLVQRDPTSKWNVEYDEYPEDTYPGNCPGGPGYIVSMSTAKQLLEGSYRTRWFWVDDVFVTGIIRAKLGLPVTEVYFNKTLHKKRW